IYDTDCSSVQSEIVQEKKTRRGELPGFGNSRNLEMTTLALRHLAFSRRVLEAPGWTSSSDRPSAISNKLINCASDKPKESAGLTRQNSTTKRDRLPRIR